MTREPNHRHRRLRSQLGVAFLALNLLLFGLPTASSAQGDPVAEEPPEMDQPDAVLASVTMADVNGVEDAYMVFMDDGTSPDASERLEATVVAAGGEITSRYRTLAVGFAAANVDGATLDILRRHPQVESISQDQRSSLPEPIADEESASAAPLTDSALPHTSSWALDRIDQRDFPLDSRFDPVGDGTDVDVYILDTGIHRTHKEFAGRIRGGHNVVPNEQGVIDYTDYADCNGHGTSVAGLAAGRTLGVAQDANIYAVKVADCDGIGYASKAVEGMDWVGLMVDIYGGPAVVNLSNSFFDIKVGYATVDLWARNVLVVTSAGNEGGSACDTFPNKQDIAITVAATEYRPPLQVDRRRASSNTGGCVDLFAPGTDVFAPNSGADDATRRVTGTSFAAPLVAGTIANYLEANPTRSVVGVTEALLSNATWGTVLDARDAPNFFLYTDLRGGFPREPIPCQGKRPTIVGDGTIQGTSGDDVILGSGGDDIIHGNGGNDTICAMSGNDVVHGGSGNDSIDGGDGNDTVNGDGGNDRITGSGGGDRLNGGTGADTINGNGGDDVVSGGDGYDTVNGDEGNDQLNGQAGNDQIHGGIGNDRIDAGIGDDVIEAGAGEDIVFAQAGDDRVNGDTGADRIFGGDGADVINGGHHNDVLNGGLGEDAIQGGSGNDAIHGGNDNDRITGNDGDDNINGGHGDDRIQGSAGADYVDGGTGDDIIDGGDGDDRVTGERGNDVIRGGRGNDKLWGAEGQDRLYGIDGADQLFGNDGRDELYGGNHADRLVGGAGADTIFGDDGADTVVAGPGNDTIYGGLGNDVIDAGQGADTVLGNDGRDRINGGRDNDTIEGQTGDDVIDGGHGNDIIRGGAGADRIFGAEGDDRIWGMTGDDLLYGSTGDDYIDGGTNDDTCNGNNGTDRAVNCEVVTQVP